MRKDDYLEKKLPVMRHWKLCFLATLVSVASATGLAAQSEPASTRWTFGLEADALPYLTGGYFAAGWAGKGLWRIRLLTADVNKPDWFTQKGFTNHHITAYAAVADRFLKPGWAGWWIGGGLVYWKSTIQTEARNETVRFNNVLANGSLGYPLPLFSSIYLSPWAGLSLRIGGDQDVPVDQKTYTLPFLNPEASLKVGVFF